MQPFGCMNNRQLFGCMSTAGTGGQAMDARLARLENRLRVSRDVAEIAARHLAPPSRPE